MEEVAINDTIEPPEFTQDWETDSGREKTEACTPRTQEKGAVNPQETGPDFLVSVQESLVEVWVGGGAAGLGALSVTVHAWDLLKEVAIIFIISTIVSPQVK